MLKNYLTMAVRQLLNHRKYAFINILGLAIGMTCTILILLYVQDELSYDRFHAQADRIYRVVDGKKAKTLPPIGPGLQENFPEVISYARLRAPQGVWMMSYADHVFYEELVYWADGSLFDVFTFPLIQGSPQTALKAPFSVVISEAMARKYLMRRIRWGKSSRAIRIM